MSDESAAIAGYDLRPIGDVDHDFLYRVYADSRADEMAVVDWSEEQKEQFLCMQFDMQHSYYQEHYADSRFDVILEDGEAIGRLYVRRSAGEILIVDIALLASQQGQGKGGRIMRELLAEAAQSGAAVRIHVEVFNPAMRLYENLGFREINEVGVYKYMEWLPDRAA